MTVYRKVSGVWQPASQVYAKRNGVWTLSTNAYVKRSGVWTQAYLYDVTPPDPPEISTFISENFDPKGNLMGRWISVGVRTGSTNNPNIRRIRVLTTYNNTYPTSPEGGTFTGGPAENWPDEPWSEWRYNGFGSHAVTNELHAKKWPRNAPSTLEIKPGTKFYFSAWAEDFAGNWSAIVSQSVTIPDVNNAANTVNLQTRFQPSQAGTAITGGYNDGKLIQSFDTGTGHATVGMWFYGSDIPNTVGASGTPTIINAQILVSRYEDTGSASANVYLFHHNYATPGDVPTSGRVFSEVTKLGTISRGESKWFSIPSAWWDSFNTGLKGFGLSYKDPVKASAGVDDYSVMRSVADSQRNGEVALTWREAV